MKFKRFLKENIFVSVYFFLAAFLEIIAQIFVSVRPFFTEYWVTLLVLASVIMLLLALPSKNSKKIGGLVFLATQIAIVLGVNMLYISNGTTFQKEMFYQRNDGFGTLEGVFVDLLLVLICGLVVLAYLCAAYIEFRLTTPAQKREELKQISRQKKAFKQQKRHASRQEKAALKLRQKEFKQALKQQKKQYKSTKPPMPASKKLASALCLAVSLMCTAAFCTTPIINGIAEKNELNYHHKLERNTNGNQKFGSTTNFLYEMLALIASKGVEYDDVGEAVDFIYSAQALTSDYHGISNGNNLVMIMVESFDTHVLERYSKEETALLFPNITYLMDEGVVADNFRQKEKTDTSECISLLGHYPSKEYINVSGGYSQNSYPFSLPNLMRKNSQSNGKEMAINSFHHNRGTYYNRYVVHNSFGFDRLYGIDDMEEYGMSNTWDLSSLIRGERSLDSLAMQSMKEVMFPTDNPFFTFFTTYVMHGFYEERQTLKNEGYYDILDQYGLFPANGGGDDLWRTYAATVMDFDRALGIMLDDLQQKNLLDNTTIVLFSDHNTYYNSLTAYAKNLDNRLDAEGFRIPFMIYDKKLNEAIDSSGGSRTISKFTTTADILPTICDMFGIKIWENMHFGTTIFNNTKESIVFSRVYNFFFNDKVSFYNINDIQWSAPDFTQQDLEDFIERSYIHLDKLYYLDKLYAQNYFASHPYQYPN